jgi:hypothetical protein
MAVKQAVDQFQTDDKVRVFVGNLKAAGVGLTLTAAEVVIMNDLSFVPAEHVTSRRPSCIVMDRNQMCWFITHCLRTQLKVLYMTCLTRKNKSLVPVMGDGIMESTGDIVEEILKLINKRR